MKTPTLIDMFCGAGGLSHGFAQAGFFVIAGVDFDSDSITTFKANHPHSRGLVADLSKLSPKQLGEELDIKPGELDCLAGGPPCQGFSKNRAFRHMNGVFVDDPRNHLYWHFFDYVQYFQPKTVLMENVPEILVKANGYFRDAVFERFQTLGYEAEAKVIDASEFGVPQRRRRAFFLAARDGINVTFPEPSTLSGPRPGHRTPKSANYIRVQEENINLTLFESLLVGPTVWDAMSDLQGQYADSLNASCSYRHAPLSSYQEERRGNQVQILNHFPWKLTERQLRRIRLLGEGQGQLHLPVELQTKNGYGSAYRRMQSDAQALTITTWLFHPGSGMFTHPFEDRVITIREAARIQSFQDDFVFSGKYHSQCRQVGNAVAPLVAKQVALSVLNMLGYYQHQESLLMRAMP